MNQYVALLADAKSAVSGLIFHRRVPPAIKVNHMRGRRQIQPCTARLERQHKEGRLLVLLKALDQRTPLADRRAAMQHQPFTAKNAAQKCRQRLGGFAELGKHQHFFLLGGNHLGQLAQAGKLAAVFGFPGTIAQPLRRVVANLLEAHQRGQHHALAAHAVAGLKRRSQLFHGLLVEGSLRRAQMAPGFEFDLVGQVADDPFVGFQATQDVGLDQRAQRAKMLSFCQSFGEFGKHLVRSQQARMGEIENRPQV